MKIHYGTIYIPHLNFVVVVKPFVKAPPSIPRAKAYCQRHRDHHGCTVYIPKNDTPSSVAHELIHALYFVCSSHSMDFMDEFEHMAYLMQYLMGQVLGYRWKTKPTRKP